ncbi:WD repeat-containing protein 46 [Chionoecetes opilio]|uniref:WD repeat-containing protein 46 n=1 Tax=Chionoecetes opilio TaxID=41210 RepID=A0A8J4YTC7_CHIOP|nr:WD repeat-containing protein 46 [Chionoecetes opilio]
MWTPNAPEPVASILCHPHPLRAIDVDHTGRYMATVGVDRQMKIWDARNLGQCLQYYTIGSGASNVVFSQKGLLSVAIGNIVEVMTTRKQIEVWLLGHSVPTITGAKLPSRGDVLRRFFYAHKEEKKTVQQSAAEAAKEVLDFWTRARIPTIAETSVRKKITGLFDEWKILSKSKNNSGVTPAEKQKTFQESLPDLLDIAHSDALTLMTIPEDKEFLLAQRKKGRWGSMAGLDKKLKESVCRRESSLSRSRQQTPKGEEMVELESSSSESSSPANAANTSTSSDAGVASPPKRLRTRGRKSVVSPDLVGALDRTGVSSRQALRIVAATASSLGHDPQELVLNPESIRQARAKYRSTLAKDIKETFSPLTPLTVHWDRKILPQDDGTRAERLAILVTGEGVEKLLGVPKLHSGTGDAAATAVFEALEDWGVQERVVAMCFDTTSAKHWSHNDYWSYINQSAINPPTNEDLPETLVSKRDDLIQGLKRLLQTKQPRDDYKELAELSILFLGGALPKTSIRSPGALHRARWMALIISALKMILFREQLTGVVTPREMSALQRFSSFATEIYVLRWFESTVPSYAPANDLGFAKDILQYHDESIRKACFTTLSRHFWYLSEDLIGLSLFDSRLPVSDKQAIVQAILYDEGAEEPPSE